MVNANYEPLLTTLKSIAEIPPDELDKIPPLFRVEQYQPGEFFIRADELSTKLGFVVNGLFRLYYLTPDGDEVTKSFCVEHEFIAAYSAFLLQESSRLHIEALEPSTLLVIDSDDLQRLFASHACWLTLRYTIAELLFVKKERRESELLLDDAQTRYLRFLAEYPDLEPRLKQYQIAHYLGVTPISLSRIRAHLKKIIIG